MPQDLEGRACSRRLLLSGIILATVTSGGLGSPAAHAQTAPDLSIIDRRVKEGEKTPPRRIPVPVPRIEGAAPPAAAMQPFTLSGVIIEGATVFKPADFTKTYEKYLATRVKSSRLLKRIPSLQAKVGPASAKLGRPLVRPKEKHVRMLPIEN